MFRPAKFLCLLVVLAALGCGAAASSPPPEAGPLTVEKWKSLPVDQKYDESSFQRLRDNDPKLKSDRAWDKFMREVVIPERKKDIPVTPGEPADIR